MDELTLTYIIIIAIMGITLLLIVALARHKDKKADSSVPPSGLVSTMPGGYRPGYGPGSYTPGPLSGTPGPLGTTGGVAPRPAPPKAPPKPAVKPVSKGAPATPAKITIYEYKSVAPARLCKYCDGENDSSASRCNICGQPMS